ncbi:MAG TPA: hypothetical protein VKE96_18905 [Vicinamibacterales bacterium]|nr:hypothetical protein [Vicinamibacterales bacterium]
MTDIAVLERFARVTPLGVRLLDVATGSFVTDGLTANAYPRVDPERRTQAIANRASVFVFNGLPGLSDVERGSGDETYWAGQVPRYPFVLDVQDTQGRFLPFTLDVILPVRRLLTFGFGSPLASPLSSPLAAADRWLPLYSSPARPLLDGMGAVRAEIVDSGTGQPAAWALLEATGPGQPIAIGMADAGGRVFLPLAYPKPIVTLGSPGSPSLPITSQAWTIDFTVRYSRAATIQASPDLAATFAQPAATAWQDAARTTPLTQATLRFGRELVLASLTATGEPSPTLLITPAVSPL